MANEIDMQKKSVNKWIGWVLFILALCISLNPFYLPRKVLHPGAKIEIQDFAYKGTTYEVSDTNANMEELYAYLKDYIAVPDLKVEGDDLLKYGTQLRIAYYNKNGKYIGNTLIVFDQSDNGQINGYVYKGTNSFGADGLKIRNGDELYYQLIDLLIGKQ